MNPHNAERRSKRQIKSTKTRIKKSFLILIPETDFIFSGHVICFAVVINNTIIDIYELG